MSHQHTLTYTTTPQPHPPKTLSLPHPRLLTMLNTFQSTRLPLLPQVDHTADAVACLHVVEGLCKRLSVLCQQWVHYKVWCPATHLVDVCQWLAVGDELVDLQVAVKVVLDETRELAAALDTAKGATLPHTAGDQLERPLKGGTHDTNITGAIEGVVAAAVRQLDQLVLDRLAIQLRWVNKVGGAELLGPVLLGIVHVHHNDLRGLVLHGTLDDGETDTARAEDGYCGTLLDTALAGRDGRSAVTSGDTAAQQTRAVHRRLLLGNGDNRDVGHDGILGEGGCAHEVQQVLAPGPEPGRAIGHDTLALGCSDLAAQVCLPALAELALLALGCAIIPPSEVERRSCPSWPARTASPLSASKRTKELGAPGVDQGSGGVEAKDCDAMVKRQHKRHGGCLLKRDDVVPRLHVGDALTYRLDNTSTLMTQDDGEGSLGVLAGQSVGICVADSSVVDLNADLVCSWGQDFDVFDGEVLAGFPGDGGL
ncbi:hypothetical protein FJTKL_04365 [Diaporthe vaccinii]|uniref:Uncharacterized protein n=1 Tax=Diaporthe vaccinii TaxID=105482 RepID=A0ABR4F0U9_9PEZI